LITVDDLNTRLGAYGDARARTPAIDALAARGVRFERAYCQYPLCNPSRISLFSGLRPQRTGVFELERDLRDALPDAVTLPELFKRSGWTTARIGKVQHRNALDDDPRSWDLTVPVEGREEERLGELTNLTPRIRRIWGVSYLETDAEDGELVDGRTACALLARAPAGGDRARSRREGRPGRRALALGHAGHAGPGHGRARCAQGAAGLRRVDELRGLADRARARRARAPGPSGEHLRRADQRPRLPAGRAACSSLRRACR
jgi:arylsulfatase A-like enzyme